MAERPEPIIDHVPTAAELNSVDQEQSPAPAPEVSHDSEIDKLHSEKIKGEDAITELSKLLLVPEVGHTMGDLQKASAEIALTIGENINGLTTEKAFIALNLVKALPNRHIAFQSEGMAHKMLRRDLKTEIYGTTKVETLRTETHLGKAEGQKNGAVMEWMGAPIELTIGENKVMVAKDDENGWMYYMPGGRAAKVGQVTKIGRADFEGSKSDSEISREHITLSQTTKGELILADTSLNGTGVAVERFPTKAEFDASQITATIEDTRESSARKKLGNLFGRK